VTPGAFQRQYNPGVCGTWQVEFPCTDAFAAKFDPAGRLVFATYLGGSRDDGATGVAVDPAGNAYIAGYTFSPDFPVTENRLPGGVTGGAFVTKLNPAGTAAHYSTRVPGAGGASAIAVDGAGQAYIAGSTTSPDLPVTPGAFQAVHRGGEGEGDGFLCKLNARGDGLLHATYLGGSGYERVTAMTIDRGGNAYVAGLTSSRDFPFTPGAVDTLPPNKEFGWDAFVAKVNLHGSALVYAARPTGSCQDQPNAVAVDASGRAFITGTTCSQDYPTTEGALQRQTGFIGSQAFVAALSPDGQSIVYATYLGGDPGVGASVAVDSFGRAVVTGSTSDWRFPTTPGAPSRCNANDETNRVDRGFVARLDQRGSALLYATYLNSFSGDAAVLAEDRDRIFVSGSDQAGGGLIAELDLISRPGFFLDCVASLASGFSGLVAPGELVTVYGSGIGPDRPVAARPDASGRIPPELAGRRVLFDGIPAPILFTQADRMMAVVPFAIASRTAASIVVEHAGEQTNALTLPVREAVPGIFQTAWTDRAAVLNEDGKVNSPENPATRGSVISLFATGAGLMDPSVADGTLAVEPPWPAVKLPVTAYFFGSPGEVLYAGSAPGMVAGIVQVNVRVPLEIGAVDYPADLYLRVGDNWSLDRVTVSVR
jgi:uncharacterized protein (TIGR03437 family)